MTIIKISVIYYTYNHPTSDDSCLPFRLDALTTLLLVSFSGYMKLEHGTTARIVVAHPTGSIGNIGKVRRVELSWVYDMDVLQPRSLCFFWCNDRLYVNSVSVDAMDLPGRG